MMKKLLFVFAALLTMASCKKSEYQAAFADKPEARMQKSIEEVNTILAGSTNGWIATLPTSAGGGYGFYMSFDREKENVVMYADINGTSAGTARTSTYRVKANIGAELIFDTYNYLSMLADPNPNSLGGTRGSGFSSDSEFLFDHSTADSIVFIGKKYRQPLKMIKATAAQKGLYENGGYKTAIDKVNAFAAANNFPYFDLVSGASTLKVGVNVNVGNSLSSGKRVDFTGVVGGGAVNSAAAKYAYSLNGLSLLDSGIIYQGVKFVKIEWKDANTLVVYDSAGKEYIVNNSPQPLVPINLIWGTKYNGLVSEYKTINPGTSQKGADILNYYHNNLTNVSILGYSYNYGRMNLTWDLPNKRFRFDGFCSQNGGTSGWTTTTVYSYTVDADGVYKFTSYTPATGGYTSKIMTQLDAFLLNNNVKFDYYIDSGKLYAKMISVQDPSIVMTFSFN